MSVEGNLTVLYVCSDPTMGGSTQSLLNLLQSVKGRICPILLFPSQGLAVEYFCSLGHKCLVFPFTLLYDFNSSPLKTIVTHPWRMRPISFLRKDIGCAIEVQRKLSGTKVDIVHTNTSPVTVGALLAKVLHAKHVWHIREFSDIGCGINLYGGVNRLRRFINRADARIVISSELNRHWRLKPRNTFLINDSIRSSSEAVINMSKEKYFLFISYYLTEAKGTREVITAFHASGLYKTGFKLYLVGNIYPAYLAEIEGFIQSIFGRDSDSVVFYPFQKDVKPFFVKATAFIMASRQEGLGRVTAEAMFFGCPVIAYAAGGTLDLIHSEDTGYLYRTNQELRDLLIKVSQDSQEELVVRAQRFAVDNLSVEHYGSKILSVYGKCYE